MTGDQTIKQRLIGAIVLVAIAVIFLPGILGQKKQQAKFETQIPPQQKQAVAETAVNDSLLPNSTGLLGDNATNENNIVNNDKTEPTLKENNKSKNLDGESDSQAQFTKPSTASVSGDLPIDIDNTDESLTNEDNLPDAAKASIEVAKMKKAFVIQVGAFSAKQNADKLALKLEKGGLKTFVRPFFREQQSTLYRVYVGPWLKREDAEAMVKEVGDITKLRPIVIDWDPAKH